MTCGKVDKTFDGRINRLINTCHHKYFFLSSRPENFDSQRMHETDQKRSGWPIRSFHWGDYTTQELLDYCVLHHLLYGYVMLAML
jgi:hypothetical protein